MNLFLAVVMNLHLAEVEMNLHPVEVETNLLPSAVVTSLLPAAAGMNLLLAVATIHHHLRFLRAILRSCNSCLDFSAWMIQLMMNPPARMGIPFCTWKVLAWRRMPPMKGCTATSVWAIAHRPGIRILT